MTILKNIVETWFWKLARHIIYKGYGANCPTTDLEDFGHKGKMYFKATANDVFNLSRCGSCRARETIDWINKHIELINL